MGGRLSEAAKQAHPAARLGACSYQKVHACLPGSVTLAPCLISIKSPYIKFTAFSCLFDLYRHGFNNWRLFCNTALRHASASLLKNGRAWSLGRPSRLFANADKSKLYKGWLIHFIMRWLRARVTPKVSLCRRPKLIWGAVRCCIRRQLSSDFFNKIMLITAMRQ